MEDNQQKETDINPPSQQLRKKRKLALPKRGNKLTDAEVVPFGVENSRKRVKREEEKIQKGGEEDLGGELEERERKLQGLRDAWYSSLVFPRIASSKSSIAVWNPSLGIAVIEKEKGKELRKMGFTLRAYSPDQPDKVSYSKQCLYLEEAIFLADKRALFLKWRDGSSEYVSLQECYELLAVPSPASPSLLSSFTSSDIDSPISPGEGEMLFKLDYQSLNLKLDIEFVAAFATLKRHGYILRRHNPGRRDGQNQNDQGKQNNQLKENNGWDFEAFLEKECENDNFALFHPPKVTEENPSFRGWWSSFHPSQPSWPHYLQTPFIPPPSLPRPPGPEFSFLPFPFHSPPTHQPLLCPTDYGLKRSDVEKKIRIISPLYPSTSPSPSPAPAPAPAPPPPPTPPTPTLPPPSTSPSPPENGSTQPSPSPPPPSLPPLPPSLSSLIHFDVFEAKNFHGKKKAYIPSFYLIFSKVMDQPLSFELLSRLVKEQTVPVVIGLVEPGSITFINPTLPTRVLK